MKICVCVVHVVFQCFSNIYSIFSTWIKLHRGSWEYASELHIGALKKNPLVSYQSESWWGAPSFESRPCLIGVHPLLHMIALDFGIHRFVETRFWDPPHPHLTKNFIDYASASNKQWAALKRATPQPELQSWRNKKCVT